MDQNHQIEQLVHYRRATDSLTSDDLQTLRRIVENYDNPAEYTAHVLFVRELIEERRERREMFRKIRDTVVGHAVWWAIGVLAYIGYLGYNVAIHVAGRWVYTGSVK